MTEPKEPCIHNWHWRRKRNASQGYWECVRCGERSDPVGLDDRGRPLQGPVSGKAAA